MDTILASRPDQQPAAEVPEMDPRDPDFWRGRFFPNSCRDDRGEFERTRRTVVLGVDYLPTLATMRMAAAFHGPACHPVLERWRRLWVTAFGEDIEGFLAREAPRHGEDHAGWAMRIRRRAADRFGKAMVYGEAADLVYDTYLHADDGGVRDPAHHVLQDAVRHLSMVDEGVPFELCVGAVFESSRTGVVVAPDGRGGLHVMTAESHGGSALACLQSNRAVTDPYWRLDAFRERCGRPMALAKGIRNLAMVLVDMGGQGHRKAFVKGCASKSGTWVVDIPAGEGAVAMSERLIRVLGPRGLARLPYASGQFLVQAFVPFVSEHRFLVVRHRVVASTASDRERGVLDADPNRVLGTGVARLRRPADAEGEYDRGASDVVVDRPLLARMARGARDFARAMGKETMGRPGALYRYAHETDCYCIDMGETADGRVLPIEVNCLSRCGLYAADYRRVARALARRAVTFEAREAAQSELGCGDSPAWEIDGPDWWKALPKYSPVYPRTALEVHDITGWPLVAIVHPSALVDGRPVEGGVIAWVVRTPDGSLVHGTKAHLDLADLRVAWTVYSRFAGITGDRVEELVQVVTDRRSLVDAMRSEGWDTAPHKVDARLVDRMLERLGFPIRPEPTPGQITRAGLAAFPSSLSDASVGAVPGRLGFGDEVWMLDVPRMRTLGTRALDGDGSGPAWLRERPVPAEWSARQWPGAEDCWPVPGGDALAANRRDDMTGFAVGPDEGRIAASLAAHAPGVRLAGRVDEEGVSAWLVPFDGDGTRDAGSLAWDLCKAYVICGQVPPTRLVLDAVRAGVPDGMPEEVVAAARRSLATGKRLLDDAEAGLS